MPVTIPGAHQETIRDQQQDSMKLSKNQKRNLAKKNKQNLSSQQDNKEVLQCTRNPISSAEPTQEDPAKIRKSILKKLRQINEIAAQKESGKTLDEDQIRKLDSKHELERLLENLKL